MVWGSRVPGINELAHELRSFVIDNRGVLVMLGDAYTEGRYGEINYGINVVSNALTVAKELIRPLDKVVS